MLALTALSGCSTISVEQRKTQDYSKLYLRGVFTWWEANPSYKVKEGSDEVYSASVKLIADGQPYDFKFADENWTPGLACGPLSNRDINLKAGAKALVDCQNPKENFKFTPNKTGLYRFIFDARNQSQPIVYVLKD